MDSSTVTSETDHSKSLDKLTSQSSRTNHESVDLPQLGLNLLSINCNLVVVSAVHGLSVDVVLFGKSLVDVKVEPLLEWRVLSSLLHDLLGNDTSEESSNGRDRAASVRYSISENLIFNFNLVV